MQSISRLQYVPVMMLLMGSCSVLLAWLLTVCVDEPARRILQILLLLLPQLLPLLLMVIPSLLLLLILLLP